MRRAVVLMAAWAALAASAQAQVIAPLKPYDPAVVRVAGKSEIYLPPDEARVDVGFFGAGKTAAEAIDLAGGRARALEAAVKAVAAPAAVAIERSNIAVQPVMQDGGARRPDKVRGYEANMAVTIHVKDLAALAKVVEAAVNAEPDTFSDVRFSVRDTLAARRKAREAAVADAVDKARIYAEGAGHKLGRLLEVQEGDVGGYIAQTGNRAIAYAVTADAAAIAPPPIAAEPQLYGASVSLVFEIGPAAPR